jgi:photosystem II stability/assembly factor-like uncharacterized protein
LVAFGTLAFASFYNGVFILKTTSKGLNWTRWDFVEYGFSAEDYSLAVTDSNHVWCGVNQVPSGIDKIIMTTNGGTNWIITEIEAGMIGPQNIRFSGDNQTGVFVGLINPPYVFSFFRTSNSGYNWSIVYTPADVHYSRAMRWVLGTSNIYECSEYVLVRSTNNGVNWTAMTGTPASGMTALDAVRINENQSLL